MKTLNEKIRENVKNSNANLWSFGKTDNTEYLIFEDKERDCYIFTSENGIWEVKRTMLEYFTATEIIKAMTEKKGE